MSTIGGDHVEPSSGPQGRYATRYEPSRRDACLSWWERPPELDPDSTLDEASCALAPQHHFALLIDISHTGAALALDRVPRSEAVVWLRLEGDGLTDWTEAEVVGVTTTTGGPHLVRLAFRAPCPFETLRSAVCG